MWGWKLTVLEYNNKLLLSLEGLENNSAGIQQLSKAEIQKQETFKYYIATTH